MMELSLKHLLHVFECQAFELCGPYETEGRIDYYVPYMMNDAVEDYLILRGCRMVGTYVADLEAEQEAQLAETEAGFVLAVRQGQENAFTLYFEEIEEKVQCYQYHRIGHFWVKGQEQWRQLVYMLGTIHDKFSFLGEAFCNAKEAGDGAYVKWISLYRRFPWLKGVLTKQLLSPKREDLYRLLFRKVAEASLLYPEREYGAEVNAQMEMVRNSVQDEMKSRGFRGTYPVFEKSNQQILVTEEHPFTILEWNHYKFRVQFMVSECRTSQENKLNSGFFHGRGGKGWIETYDKF